MKKKNFKSIFSVGRRWILEIIVDANKQFEIVTLDFFPYAMVPESKRYLNGKLRLINYLQPHQIPLEPLRLTSP